MIVLQALLSRGRNLWQWLVDDRDVALGGGRRSGRWRWASEGRSCSRFVVELIGARQRPMMLSGLRSRLVVRCVDAVDGRMLMFVVKVAFLLQNGRCRPVVVSTGFLVGQRCTRVRLIVVFGDGRDV